MERAEAGFHFPPDMQLHSNPLAEAWVEIRWQLVPLDGNPEFKIDPYFKFALGAFRQGISEIYSRIEDLPASHVPEEIAPYVVRHRFRSEPDGWPLVQIGPGVASVNFLQYDRWKTFEEAALYLKEQLVAAYRDTELITESVALRYRDTEPFSHSSDNFLEFIQNHLNTSVTLPSSIPGFAGRKHYPTHVDLNFTFDLNFPEGKGAIRISTGTKQKDSQNSNAPESEEVVIWQHEIVSKGDTAPAINDSAQFEAWLRDAHSVIHEWFFSLIDGPLLRKYQSD